MKLYYNFFQCFKWLIFPEKHFFCIILFTLALSVATIANARSALSIDSDIVATTIKDEKGNFINLYIPAIFNNDQCGRRIYGTPPAILGMFETLYYQKRPTDSYESVIRDFCLQPQTADNESDQIINCLSKAGIAKDGIDLITEFIEKGANSIDKKFVKGDNAVNYLKNRLAAVGRDLNKINKDSTFSKLCLALSAADYLSYSGQTAYESYFMSTLHTDLALERLELLKKIVEDERSENGNIDPALIEALERAGKNWKESATFMGALIEEIKSNPHEFFSKNLGMGSAVASYAMKLSAGASAWIWSGKLTFDALNDISNQWKTSQDAVSAATLIKLIDGASGADEKNINNLLSYGQKSYYHQMESVFSVSSAKFADHVDNLLDKVPPVRDTLKKILPMRESKASDWADFYKQLKSSVEVTPYIPVKSNSSTASEPSSLFSAAQSSPLPPKVPAVINYYPSRQTDSNINGIRVGPSERPVQKITISNGAPAGNIFSPGASSSNVSRPSATLTISSGKNNGHANDASDKKQTDLEKYMKKIEQTSEKIARLKKAREKLKIKSEKLKLQFDKFMKEKSQIAGNKDAIERMRADVNNRFNSVNAMIDQHNAEAASVDRTNSAQLNAYNNEKRSLEAEVRKIKNKNDELNRLINDHNDTINSLSQKQNRLKYQINEIEAQENDLKKQTDALITEHNKNVAFGRSLGLSERQLGLKNKED